MAPSPTSHTIFYANGAEKVPATAILFSSHKPGAEWSWLSNFYEESFVDHKGVTYRSAENYFQAAKAWMMEDRAMFRKMIKYTPIKAKTEGNKMKLDVEKWNQISGEIMACALYFKFGNKPLWIQALVNTGDALIVESREDMVWGSGLIKSQTAKTRICNWPGQNKLGDALMDIRLYFRKLLQNGKVPSIPPGISTTQVSGAPAVDTTIANGIAPGREPSPVPTQHPDPGTGVDIVQDPEADENPDPMDLDQPVASTSDPDIQEERLTFGGEIEAGALNQNPIIEEERAKAGEGEMTPEERMQAEADAQKKRTDEDWRKLVLREEALLRERQEENRRRRVPQKFVKLPIYDTDSEEESDDEERQLVGPADEEQQLVGPGDEEEEYEEGELEAERLFLKSLKESESKQLKPSETLTFNMPLTPPQSAENSPVKGAPKPAQGLPRKEPVTSAKYKKQQKKRKANRDPAPKAAKKQKAAKGTPKTSSRPQLAAGLATLGIASSTTTRSRRKAAVASETKTKELVHGETDF